MAPAKPRKNRAPLNLAMGIVGLVALIGMTVSSAMDFHSGISTLCLLVFVTSITTMFFTRNSDEYTAGLWVSATNGAFIMLVAWLFIGPFLAGVIEGFNAAHEGREASKAQANELLAAGTSFSLFAFYIIFNIKRLTGAL